jgi:hypothetical protein
LRPSTSIVIHRCVVYPVLTSLRLIVSIGVHAGSTRSVYWRQVAAGGVCYTRTLASHRSACQVFGIRDSCSLNRCIVCQATPFVTLGEPCVILSVEDGRMLRLPSSSRGTVAERSLFDVSDVQSMRCPVN